MAAAANNKQTKFTLVYQIDKCESEGEDENMGEELYTEQRIRVNVLHTILIDRSVHTIHTVKKMVYFVILAHAHLHADITHSHSAIPYICVACVKFHDVEDKLDIVSRRDHKIRFFH